MNLDPVDWALLELLQTDARMPFAELARHVNLSAPATAERIRRLESAGVIRGYRADVDPRQLGLPILAIARVRYPAGGLATLGKVVDTCPEVIECHHVTGDDCFVVKIVARSMSHLEEIADTLTRSGTVATSVVYSTPLAHRVLTSDVALEPY